MKFQTNYYPSKIIRTLLIFPWKSKQIPLTEIAKNSSNVVKSSNSVTDNILNVYKLAKVASKGTEKSLRLF